MNWETYTSMNKEQKEEYDFKFKGKRPILEAKGTILWTSLMLGLITQFMMVIYLAVVDEKFANLKDQILDLLVAASNVVVISLWIIIGIVVVWCISLIYFGFSEWKWMKDNKVEKIKTKYFWQKNE